LPLALRAYAFARDAHGQQRRESDAARFIVHPLEVASLLHNTGHSERLVVAGILHDTIEDSPATAQSINARFGADVAAIVAAMTEDETIESFSRAKRGEPVLDAHNPSAHAKLEHYRASLEMLERIAAEHPLVRQLRFELEVLDGLPPRPDLLTADQP
jgi:(p)ppGpp synthase/HD superfamily hydrolase